MDITILQSTARDFLSYVSLFEVVVRSTGKREAIPFRVAGFSFSACLSRTPENFPRLKPANQGSLIEFKEIGAIPTSGTESCQIHSLYFCIEERVEV